MKALPEGTVTFLFTDIEGSTRLWEEYGASMQSALAQHDSLMRREIEAVGGTVFKTMGDAFCAVFPDSKAALQAAVSAQLALHTEQWPDGITLKVRMAVHTGTAELRDHDYFGTTLNRSARILATAHGGQVILSEAAHTLCAGEQIAGSTYSSLGTHRLKDLERPEHIFQLCHPDLPSEFPPLRALSQHTHNLPVQLTSFVGREKEKHTLIEMLAGSRLVTLAGSGGCGKTRLALQTAAELLEEFPQGVWLVELATVTDPSQVPQALADVLGVREVPGNTLTNTLCNALKGRNSLILLDNCEHLLDAASKIAETLLKQCPYVHILASSREGLGVPGERVYRIPSLSTPPANGSMSTELEKYESVQLFVERARLHLSEFDITTSNADSVGAVCARLDGIPLAIELAAARIRSMSVNEIEKRLDQRFRLLTGGSRAVLPRQQTLRQLIDWSYDLLNDREQTMLQRVSVFMGGWSLECAEQVCSGGEIEEWEVLDLLTSLSDKSLVVVDTVSDAELGDISRYRLLETVRQYSLERLTETGGAEAARCRHRDWFVNYAEKAEPYLEGNGQVVWLERIAEEHENIITALNWCSEEGETGDCSGTEKGLKLAVSLSKYWAIRGLWRACHLDVLLAQPVERISVGFIARALNSAGTMTFNLGNYASAKEYYSQALAICRELGNRPGESGCLSNFGMVEFHIGNYAAACEYFKLALDIIREIGDRRKEASFINNIGNVALETGDYSAASMYYKEALIINREIGNRQFESINLRNLGEMSIYTCDYTAAIKYLELSLAVSRELGDRNGEASSLGKLGNVASDTGHYATAWENFDQALSISRELPDRKLEAECVQNEGVLALREKQYSKASELLRQALSLCLEISQKHAVTESLEAFGSLFSATSRFELSCQMLGAAHSAREALGAPLPPSKVARVERDREACRSALSDAEYERCWAAGAALSLEQAAALALEATYQ